MDFLDTISWDPPADDLFVRPDWKQITAHIEKLPPAERRTAWQTAILRWLKSLQQVLNALIEASGSRHIPYRIDGSGRFLFLTHYPPDIAADLPPIAEAFRTLAHETLGPRIANDPPHQHPILLFHDIYVLHEYLRPWRTNAGRIAGVFLFGPPPHIVLRNSDRFNLRLTLLHELNHATLFPLPLPLWIHEGLSRYFETRLLAKANLRYADEVRLDRNRYWRETGLDTFWSGKAFHDGHVRPATLLAQRLISRLLVHDRDAFTEFLLAAQRADAGNQACVSAYGKPLLQFVTELLGAGNWTGPAAPPASAASQPSEN